MAQDIVSGLFGLSPAQVQQQQQQQLALQAQRYAQQDPLQAARAGMYQAGAGLAQAGAEGLFGMQNPEVVAAQQRQAMAQQMDLTTPQGTYAAAKMAQDRGDVEMAAKLAAMARQMEEEQSTQAFRAAQTQQMLTPKAEKVDMTNIEKLYAARDRALAAGNQQLANSIDAIIRKETKVGGVGGAAAKAGKEAATSVKEPQKAKAANEFLESKMAEIEYALADTLGVGDKPESLRSFIETKPQSAANRLESVTGFIQGRFPAMSQESANIRQHITRLKDLAQTIGIAELRQAGIAPGSVTEKEWPKFQASLANIDETLSGQELLTQYKRILKKFDDIRGAVGGKTTSNVGKGDTGNVPALPAGFTPL